MGQRHNSGFVDLAEVFRRVQQQMIAHLSATGTFQHCATQGAAMEQNWIDLLTTYLPRRYRIAPAFVINSAGMCSRQIDIAIFDNHGAAPLFPHPAGVHIPIESVYAAFEVKAGLTGAAVKDAGEKAASIRELQEPASRPILAGILAARSDWPTALDGKLQELLQSLPPAHKLDLGCVLAEASFEHTDHVAISQVHDALIFFLLRLIDRLDDLGPAPRIDLMRYVRGVTSFQR